MRMLEAAASAVWTKAAEWVWPTDLGTAQCEGLALLGALTEPSVWASVSV